jgi:fluoroquinolone resistance protein
VNTINDDQETYIDINFKNTELRAAAINSKEFDNCTFSGCNFSDSAFINCKFYECNFVNCNLSMVSVIGCSFFDVAFEDSKLTGINWTKASWPRIKLSSPFRFDKCILNNASFYGLGLKEIAIIECKAKEVDFRECDCSGANFTYTDFENSLFGKTNLAKADFSEASNYNIDLLNNNIKNAKFSLPEAINLLNSLEIEIN